MNNMHGQISSWETGAEIYAKETIFNLVIYIHQKLDTEIEISLY